MARTPSPLRIVLTAVITMVVAIRVGAWLMTSAPPAMPGGDGEIAGIVVDDSGRPIVGVALGLALSSAPDRLRWPAASAADGRFHFANLPRELFVLRSTKAGFLGGPFVVGAGDWGHTPIDLTDANYLHGLRVEMRRAGAISGVALDAAGRPLARYGVSARRIVNGAEDTTFQTGLLATTDVNGRYRLSELQPGDYRIRVRRPDDKIFRLYFPAVMNPSDAELVTVGPGEERAGVDLRIPGVGRSDIEGVVPNTGGFTYPLKVSVFDADAPVISNDARTTEAGPDGRFGVSGLPAGRYLVVAQTTTQRSTPVGDRSSHLLQHSGAVVVETSGVRPARTTLRLDDGVRVSGYVRRAGLSPAGLTVRLVATDTETEARLGAFRVLAQTMVDGSFSISHVPPGRYLVTISEHDVVSTIRKAGSTVAGDRLEVATEDVGGIDIDVVSHTAEIRGTVRTSDGSAAPAAIVVAFPADARPDTAAATAFHVARPATSGRFVMDHLPPGAIAVIAVKDLPKDAWQRPATIDALRAAATRVVLEHGQSRTVELIAR